VLSGVAASIPRGLGWSSCCRCVGNYPLRGAARLCLLRRAPSINFVTLAVGIV
jgi:hypothetical protein